MNHQCPIGLLFYSYMLDAFSLKVELSNSIFHFEHDACYVKRKKDKDFENDSL